MFAAWMRWVFALGIVGIAFGACNAPVEVKGPGPTLEIVSGSDQSAELGTTLALPFIAIVKDGNHEPLSDVSVVFEVTSGGGTLSAASVKTDAMGQAQTTLTVGAMAGANTVTASAP